MAETSEIRSLPRPSQTRRTQAERRARSDRNLLLAAADLIAEEGYNAATFEKVGARAGYSRGLASQRFGSKDGLIEALIGHLHERSLELITTQGGTPTTGLDAILTTVDVYLRNFENEQAIRSYFVAMAGSVATLSGQRAAFAASHMHAKERFEEAITLGQADGTISKDLDAEAAALMIGSLILGISTQWLIDTSTDLERIRRTTLDTLRRSLAARW
jgi:AcrR family transcriptional regulator